MIVDINSKIIMSDKYSINFDDILNELKPFPNDIVYLGGSLIEGTISVYSEGMGNCYSDIDVFIIREKSEFDKTEAVYSSATRKTYFVDSLLNGADIEVYSSEFVYSLKNVLNRHKISADVRIANVFENVKGVENDLFLINTFLNRLYYSICIYNHETYSSLKSGMSFRKFLKIKDAELTASIENLIPDVKGNLEVGQIDVALYCMREAYLKMMNFILVSEDIFVDRTKWIPLKFKNLCNEKSRYSYLWDEYLQLFRLGTESEKECYAVVESNMATVKKAMEDVLMKGLAL
ncbi:MAG: hypothetical protein FWC20_00905 [Oscillospiraceae bacterium]|nr:hypothetical protein [Oscillospiraceae bacterium]MCL2277953.1 hypothetical protein [Oscillospiraceae bacterium]